MSEDERGEIGDTVLWRCLGRHQGAPGTCHPGDYHPALVLEVLRRDDAGQPNEARLVVFTSGPLQAAAYPNLHPKIEQVDARRGAALGEWRPRSGYRPAPWNCEQPPTATQLLTVPGREYELMGEDVDQKWPQYRHPQSSSQRPQEKEHR